MEAKILDIARQVWKEEINNFKRDNDGNEPEFIDIYNDVYYKILWKLNEEEKKYFEKNYSLILDKSTNLSY